MQLVYSPEYQRRLSSARVLWLGWYIPALVKNDLLNNAVACATGVEYAKAFLIASFFSGKKDLPPIS